jgi:hypothetical protein
MGVSFLAYRRGNCRSRGPVLPALQVVGDPQHFVGSLHTLRSGYEKTTDSERGKLPVARVVRAHGGQNVEGPGNFGQQHPTFYAVFFEYPPVNRLEVCHYRMDK